MLNVMFGKVGSETGSLTQNLDFHRLAAVELRGALDLGEGHVVAALKPMAGFIQTRHHARRVLTPRRGGERSHRTSGFGSRALTSVHRQ